MASVETNRAYIRFERALPWEVREMIERAPIAYVPLGALEWHGEHAALGLDGLKSEAICARCAERTGGVLFPAMYWGAFHTLRFPFTFHFSSRALRRQVRRTLESLADWGFRSIVLLTGHYPVAQLSMLRRECRRVAARRGVGALGLSEAMLTADIGYIGDHAAKWETSLLMALVPELVDLSRLPEDTGSLDERFARHGIDGVCPRRFASADEGRRALEVIVERLSEAALRMSREGSTEAAEAIYAAHARVFRRPIAAAKTAFGTDSTWEALIHVAKSVRHNRHL